jgi:CBS domain-containing protein
MNLGELFRSEVVTVEPDEPIREAANMLRGDKVGAVVVVAGRKVVGIVTDRDMALATILDGVDPQEPVSRIMTSPVVTIRADQGVFNATQYFGSYKVRRLPIVNDDNELVGIVTLDDIIALLGKEMMNVSRNVAPVLVSKEP